MNKPKINLRVSTVTALLAAAAVTLILLPAGAQEETAPEMDWTPLPDSIITAKDECCKAITIADQQCESDTALAELTRNKALAEAQDDLLEAIQKAIKAAERTDKPDVAAALQEAADSVTAQTSAPTDPVSIVGIWLFTSVNGTTGTFAFYSDGVVKEEGQTGPEHSGSWRVTDGRVVVNWGGGVWCVLRMPLDPECAVGDDLYGIEAFVAVKQETKIDQPADGVNWDDFSNSVRRAKTNYDKAVAKAIADCDRATQSARATHTKAVRAAVAPLVRELQKHRKAAVRDNNIGLIVNLDKAIQFVQSEMAPREPEDILLGKWSSRGATWTFAPNGAASINYDSGGGDSGRWRITDGYVSVIWTTQIKTSRSSLAPARGPSRMATRSSLDTTIPMIWAVRQSIAGPRWSALRLPLDESGTTVDSWEGLAETTIQKIHEDTD